MPLATISGLGTKPCVSPAHGNGFNLAVVVVDLEIPSTRPYLPHVWESECWKKCAFPLLPLVERLELKQIADGKALSFHVLDHHPVPGSPVNERRFCGSPAPNKSAAAAGALTTLGHRRFHLSVSVRALIARHHP